MVASGMCHLVIYFPKIYHSGEEGALITKMFIFKSDTPPTLLPLSLSNTFEGHGYCGWGVNRTGQRLKTTPARFFLGVDFVLLDFFLGVDLVLLDFFLGVDLVFLRGEGLVGIF